MTTSRRQRRVAEFIKEELNELIERQMDDPRLQWVTITDVEATPDLQVARVYFRVIGEPDRRMEALDGLQHAKGYLRRELAAKLKLRLVPDLLFFHDDSPDLGQHIEDMLEKLHKDDAGHADA